jgi:hypothetical protein
MYEHMVEKFKFIRGAEPKNYTGAAMADAYVSLKNYGTLTIKISTGAWAGGTAAVTLTQATAVAGTGAKAIAFTDYWDDVTTTGTLVKKAAVSNTFNLATANKSYVIHVDDRMLDVAGGFDCVTLAIASPGANNDFYNVEYILGDARYQQATPPSALVD